LRERERESRKKEAQLKRIHTSKTPSQMGRIGYVGAVGVEQRGEGDPNAAEVERGG
jgi:hypothetical protein